MTLSSADERRQSYEEAGFLMVDDLGIGDEIDWLREVYDGLFARRAGREEGLQFDLAGRDEDDGEATLPQIIEPAHHAPELLDSQLLLRASELARELLGTSTTVRFAHAIYKPARIGPETPWHQDAAYWDPSIHHSKLSIWVPLQPATIDNGCMQFVRGSHLHDVIPHRHIGDDPRIAGLELEPEEMHHVSDPIVCPLGPGGATVHSGYTLHYTGPNRSSMPRRALILDAHNPSTDRPRHQRRTFAWQTDDDAASERRRAAESN